MNIAIIKYNAGNTKSVENALHRVGIQPIISDDIEIISTADKVIFPGVGHAETTMQFLKQKKLDVAIKNLKQPVLGICLGQQLMCDFSEEGNVECLGIFPVQVKKFSLDNLQFKIPQIGWNSIYHLHSALLRGVEEKSFTYFVHSYYCEMSEYTIATCNYGHPFSAALQRDNFYAVQFHPEKSAAIGVKIIENFISI